MCGIVGYVGDRQATSVLLEGLSRLEYRGYDSAGVAVVGRDGVAVRKYQGRLKVLADHLREDPLVGSVGVGHTRWATHGVPSDRNAHPHTNDTGSIAVVHNGIIENYRELREWLEGEGIVFRSETDTEVIAHLLEYYQGDLLEAMYKATERMEGAYAIGAVSQKEPERIVAVRKDSPLIIGLGEGENYLASDIPALLKYTREMLLVENNEFVVLTKDSVRILDSEGCEVQRPVFRVDWDAQAAEKGGYEHFMLKEIYEQPRAVAETLLRRLDTVGEIVLEGIGLTPESLASIHRVYIVGCGTAYHAGLVGKTAIQTLAGIPVEVEVASEFRYQKNFIDHQTLVIAISQSGETLDTLAAIREAKEQGARVLSVVNVVGSSVARDSDDVLYTWAGPEIAVASTKAYTTQLVALYVLALYMGRALGRVSYGEHRDLLAGLGGLSGKIQGILKEATVEALAQERATDESVFFMGRGVDLAVAHEGSLKLKEISYINSSAVAAGELKHGSIALIDQGSLVLAVATQEHLLGKMISNTQEVRARGGYVVAIAQEGRREMEGVADRVWYIPETQDLLTPILSVIYLQLFAYFMAVARGCDVDKPRNLAKSVTVE